MKMKLLPAYLGLAIFGLLLHSGLADISVKLRNSRAHFNRPGRQASTSGYLPPANEEYYSIEEELAPAQRHTSPQFKESRYGNSRYQIFEVHNHFGSGSSTSNPTVSNAQQSNDYQSVPHEQEIHIQHVTQPATVAHNNHVDDENLDVSYLSFAAAEGADGRQITISEQLPATTTAAVPFPSNYQHDFPKNLALSRDNQLAAQSASYQSLISQKTKAPSATPNYRAPAYLPPHVAQGGQQPQQQQQIFKGPTYLPPHQTVDRVVQQQQSPQQQYKGAAYLPPHTTTGHVTQSVATPITNPTTTYHANEYLPPNENINVVQHQHHQNQHQTQQHYHSEQHQLQHQSQQQHVVEQHFGNKKPALKPVFKGPAYLPPLRTKPVRHVAATRAIRQGEHSQSNSIAEGSAGYLPPGYDYVKPEDKQTATVPEVQQPQHQYQEQYQEQQVHHNAQQVQHQEQQVHKSVQQVNQHVQQILQHVQHDQHQEQHVHRQAQQVQHQEQYVQPQEQYLQQQEQHQVQQVQQQVQQQHQAQQQVQQQYQVQSQVQQIQQQHYSQQVTEPVQGTAYNAPTYLPPSAEQQTVVAPQNAFVAPGYLPPTTTTTVTQQQPIVATPESLPPGYEFERPEHAEEAIAQLHSEDPRLKKQAAAEAAAKAQQSQQQYQQQQQQTQDQNYQQQQQYQQQVQQPHTEFIVNSHINVGNHEENSDIIYGKQTSQVAIAPAYQPQTFAETVSTAQQQSTNYQEEQNYQQQIQGQITPYHVAAANYAQQQQVSKATAAATTTQTAQQFNAPTYLPPGYDYVKPEDKQTVTVPEVQQPQLQYQEQYQEQQVQHQEQHVQHQEQQVQHQVQQQHLQQHATAQNDVEQHSEQQVQQIAQYQHVPQQLATQQVSQQHIQQQHVDYMHSLRSYMTTVQPNERYADAQFTEPRQQFAVYGPPATTTTTTPLPLYAEQTTRPQYYAAAMSYAANPVPEAYTAYNVRSTMNAATKQSLAKIMPKEIQEQQQQQQQLLVAATPAPVTLTAAPAAATSGKIRTVQIVAPNTVKTLKVLETSDQAGVKTIKILGPSHDDPMGTHRIVKVVSQSGSGAHEQTVKIFNDHQEVSLPLAAPTTNAVLSSSTSNNAYLPPPLDAKVTKKRAVRDSRALLTQPKSVFRSPRGRRRYRF